MPSPVAHSLIGLALGSAALVPSSAPRELGRRLYDLRWPLLGCMVLANLPDLDYIPGILVGDLNRFHHHYTHTLGFVALALAGIWIVASHRGVNILLLGLALLLSHLVADMLTQDGSAPYGIMALWPVTEARLLSPVSLFPAFKKDYLAQVFDPRNLWPVCVELLWCGGLLIAVLVGKVYRGGRSGVSVSP